MIDLSKQGALPEKEGVENNRLLLPTFSLHTQKEILSSPLPPSTFEGSRIRFSPFPATGADPYYFFARPSEAKKSGVRETRYLLRPPFLSAPVCRLTALKKSRSSADFFTDEFTQLDPSPLLSLCKLLTGCSKPLATLSLLPAMFPVSV